jgi:putative membrane protein
MKKLSLIIIAGVSALMMQACHHSPKIPNSIKEADSTNAANDTTSDTDKRVQAEITDNDDAKFMVRAASGGLSEVELGNLAIKKAHNANVRAFGAMMVADHSKANKLLIALADSDRISLPQYPGKKDEKLSDDLIKKTGNDFDVAYVDAMVKDHQDDIKDFQKEVKDAKKADIKAFAQSTLPVLQKHLSAITAIQDSMKHNTRNDHKPLNGELK